VKRWTTIRFGLSTAALALLSAGCGSMNSAMTMTGLQARAQTMANGMEMQLTGQFQTAPQGMSLTGELDNPTLTAGTPVSFCLVRMSGTMALAAPPAMDESGQVVAQFVMNSQNGQGVPSVSAGDRLEARQGATSAGSADCMAPLLLSATFQADMSPVGMSQAK